MADLPVTSVSENPADANFNSQPERSVNFNDLHQQAMAKLTESATPPAAQETPVVEKPAAQVPATEAPKAAAEGAPAETPKAPETPAVETPAEERKPVALKDDDLVEVIVDGAPQLMSYKDAKAGWSRTSKFTQEMQRVAAERQQVEQLQQQLAPVVEQRDFLVGLLNNKQLLDQYVAKAFGQAQAVAQEQIAAATGADPNDIATVAQAKEIATQQMQSFEQKLRETEESLTKRIAQETQLLEHRREIAGYAAEIDNTISQIFTENPVLRKIPNSEELIRYQVAQLQPRTVEEAKEHFINVAKGIVEDLRGEFAASQKQQVVEKQKLTDNNIEPPGGAAPTIQPFNYKTPDGKVSWDALRKRAEQLLG